MYGFPLGNMAENQQKALSNACANKICSAHSAPFWNFLMRFCGLSTGWSTPSCHIFWRGMKEHDRFTTISNSVDTCGVFWFFGWAILSENKTRKKAETWSLRFALLTIEMCIWDYKSSRLVLRCWCLTSINREVVCGDDREIFVMIIKGSLEFDLILLQLWNKIR